MFLIAVLTILLSFSAVFCVEIGKANKILSWSYETLYLNYKKCVGNKSVRM